MAEKESKADRIEKELKALREGQEALRKEFTTFRKDFGEIPFTDPHEFKAILDAQGSDEFLCGGCNAPVDKGETVCKACGLPLSWPTE